MDIKSSGSRDPSMDQEYSVYGPEASYVHQYPGLQSSMPSQQNLHEMQPPHFVTHQHSIGDFHIRNCGNGRAPPPPSTPLPSTTFMTAGDSGCKWDSDTASGSSRRKNSDYDYETGDDSTRSTRAGNEGRKNHSEIEKRRRDKMNTYITELSSMIPMCGAMSRKLDKLTVLRMTVQHLKSVHGAAHAFPEGRFKPEFLSERELKMLILQAADGFLFVADCDRGRMIYVSESVTNSLQYSQADLLGQSLFDILHPKDVAKVKEQLSSPDVMSRERLIDAKTMLPVHMDVVTGTSRLSPGARRSFFCRMKVKPGQERRDRDLLVKQEQETGSSRHMDRRYCVVQCTGYLKAWTSSEINDKKVCGSSEDDNGTPTGSLSCLVAVGRTMPELPRCQPERPAMRKLQFVSRHAPDGKFVYVDQRVTPAVGYLPQELHGTSLYEYVATSHMNNIALVHKEALQTRTPQCTAPYPFRRKDRTWASVQTDWRPFRNPWTKEVECLVAQNTILELYTEPPLSVPEHTGAYFRRGSEHDVQQVISSQLESHKIGTSIADEVMRQANSTVSTPELSQEMVVYQQEDQASDESSLTSASLPNYAQVRNNVVLSDGVQPEIEDVLRVIATPSDPSTTPRQDSPPDGNDEAAMAVIMSLLEADAGLGGPVDFSGLPWPLP